MKIYLHRLSLTDRPYTPSLLDYDQDATQEAEKISRRDYLLKCFASEQVLSYKASGQRAEFRYIFSQIDDGIIAGVIAKKKSVVGLYNSNDPMDEVPMDEWETADIFLNIEDDEQVIGIENNIKITSSPLKTLSDLMYAINEKNKHKDVYKIDVFPLHNELSFWEAIENHSGKVTSLKIEMVVPNPDSTSSTTAAELKALQDEISMQEKTEIYQSDEGLNIDTKTIKDREKYVSHGGGGITAKEGAKIIYSSEKSTTCEEISDDHKITKNPKIAGIISALRAILRR